jgi:serine/threonine-protein kinase
VPGVASPKAEAPPKKSVARAERKEKPLTGGGRVELAVAPWGEVLVDGKSRGLSPPLRVVDLSAGAHTIEIRNSTFPAHVEQVQVKAGEAVKIRHRFR